MIGLARRASMVRTPVKSAEITNLKHDAVGIDDASVFYQIE